MKIEKYTFGTGDRFARQGRAQLQAVLRAREAGIDVHPVWNKSNGAGNFSGWWHRYWRYGPMPTQPWPP